MYGYVLKGSKAVHFKYPLKVSSTKKIEKVPTVLSVERPYLFWRHISYCVNTYNFCKLNFEQGVRCDSELKTDLLSADFISLGSGGFLEWLPLSGGFLPRNFWRIWTKGALAHYRIFFSPHKQKYN